MIVAVEMNGQSHESCLSQKALLLCSHMCALTSWCAYSTFMHIQYYSYIAT